MPDRDNLFRFNPFQIEQWEDEQVIEQYTILSHNLLGGDTPMEITNDIEIYSDMGYLVGEMVARYTEYVSNDSAQLKNDIANLTYLERDQWLKEKADKPPAMSYFESKATSMKLKEQIILNQKDAKLKRYKYAYDSIQDKQNALKKRLESIKFETYGR